MRSNNLVVEVCMRLFILLIISVLVSGCFFLNDVNPFSTPDEFLANRATPPAERAIVIFGLSVEGPGYHAITRWFSVHMDEYSIERQSITGNCWRSNNMEAKVPGIIGTRQYFSFDVKPGYYVSREFLDASDKNLVFEVPAGRVVYLGEFVWTSESRIGLKRDPSTVKSYFGGDVLLANTRQVSQVKGILCGP